jgi:hypothetical protein
MELLQLFQKISKAKALAMVEQIDDEIETFRDVTQMEEDDSLAKAQVIQGKNDTAIGSGKKHPLGALTKTFLCAISIMIGLTSLMYGLALGYCPLFPYLQHRFHIANQNNEILIRENIYSNFVVGTTALALHKFQIVWKV